MLVGYKMVVEKYTEEIYEKKYQTPTVHFGGYVDLERRRLSVVLLCFVGSKQAYLKLY